MRQPRIWFVLATCVVFLSVSPLASQCISLNAFGSSYTQDFNSLANSGTANTVLPNGWKLAESGTSSRNNSAYAASTGSDTSGDVYSFGASGSTERAFGTLLSSSLTPTIGACFTNGTGGTMTSLAIAYTGEEWRFGATGRADRLDFQYSTDATSLATGTWTDVNALDFSSPNMPSTTGPLDGNAAQNRSSISSTITGLGIPNGTTFWIRWNDFNAAGSDDGLAVDDFSLLPDGVVPTSLTATPAVSPATASAGHTLLITVAVAPGSNPPSSGIVVTGDLSPIGGAASQTLFDDGTHGDVTAGDNVFSYSATISPSTSPGFKTLTFTATDAQLRSIIATATLGVSAGPSDIVISQVYGGGGNSGADLKNDFVELFNRGTATVDLTGWSVQYASSTGSSWQVTPLSGSIDPGHYYLVREAAGSGGTTDLPAPDAPGTIPMAAGSGKIALVNSTPALSGGCPLTIVDLVGYGSSANCFEGSGPTGTLSNPTAATRRKHGCIETNDNAVDFGIAAPAPHNSASPAFDCSQPALSLAIHQIQGNGAASPYEGVDVTTAGIVTAKKTNGFFLQTNDIDGDDSTSEGVFVFTTVAPKQQAGDFVTVTGTVSEYFNLTEINAFLADIATASSGNPLPAAVTLTPEILNPHGTLDQLEQFEGMRVHADSLTTVGPTNAYGEVVTVSTGVPRPFREPGMEASRPLPDGSPCCIPRFDENPERLMIDTDGQVNAAPMALSSNVTLTNVTGPLDYAFGEYRVLPDTPPTATANISATPVPSTNTNEFTIASFNMLNFFSTNSDFASRLNKASLAIRNVMRMPDIIGVEEMGDIATLTAVADKINADEVALGNADPGYQALLLEDLSDPYGADIDVGYLVKSSRVTVTSVEQRGTEETFLDPSDGNYDTLFDRPPLVLRGSVRSPFGTSLPITVIVNHLQSLIDIDLNDPRGQRQREKRRRQAEFTANLVQTLQSENLVLAGDFNSYQFSDGYVDTIGTIRGVPAPADEVVLASSDLVNPDLTNLIDTGSVAADQRYSYVYDGDAQALDHILVDGAMLERVTRFAFARNNADFPASLASDANRPERVSDHDMPVAYFRFGLRESLLETIGALTTLHDATTFKQDRDKLDDARVHLGKAAASGLWTDSMHADPKLGDTIFTEAKNAAIPLLFLLKNGRSTVASQIQTWLDAIASALRTLALDAIEETHSDGARSELAKGDQDIAAGQYESGFEHYRNAWAAAMRT